MKKYIFLLALIFSVSIVAQTSGFETGGRLYGKAGSVSTAADTLSKELSIENSMASIFKNWFSFTVITDDTLQIANDVSFRSSIIILPDIPYTSAKLNIKITKDIYIKRYGSSGTPYYYISVESN